MIALGVKLGALLLLVAALVDIRRKALRWSTMRFDVVGAPGTGRGELRLLLVWRRLVVEVITYTTRGWECWTMPSIGVLWTCRIGRLRWQVRA